MAVVTISGAAGSGSAEAAQGTANLLNFELVTDDKVARWMGEEFGDVQIPDRVWRHAAASVLSRLAGEHDLVVALPGSEDLFSPAPWLLRCSIVAPEARRVGNLMLDQRLDRPSAQAELRRLDRKMKRVRKARFGRMSSPPESFDVILNAGQFDSAAIAELLRSAACARGLPGQGLLPEAAQAEIQFRTRLQLARHGIAPAGRASVKRAVFGHPSEQMFANLLDFYRIRWEYEPRSFPLQWDKDGRVLEAFTPDFFLPELDLYIELTTMKQTLVTRKNRKIKLLRSIYPHVNIQVFYQKDFQDLVFKHGLRELAR